MMGEENELPDTTFDTIDQSNYLIKMMYTYQKQFFKDRSIDIKNKKLILKPRLSIIPSFNNNGEIIEFSAVPRKIRGTKIETLIIDDLLVSEIEETDNKEE